MIAKSVVRSVSGSAARSTPGVTDGFENFYLRILPYRIYIADNDILVGTNTVISGTSDAPYGTPIEVVIMNHNEVHLVTKNTTAGLVGQWSVDLAGESFISDWRQIDVDVITQGDRYLERKTHAVIQCGVPPETRYVSASGTGTGNTSGDPAGPADVQTLIAGLSAGGQIEFAAGSYNHGKIDLSATSAGGFLKVKETGGEVVYNGTRDSWTLPADPEEVTDTSGFNQSSRSMFDLLTGNIMVEGFTAKNLTGFVACIGIRPGSGNTARTIKVRDFEGYNNRRVISNEGGTSVRYVDIRGLRATGFDKQCISLDGPNSHAVVIDDFDLNSGRQYNANDPFAVGIQIGIGTDPDLQYLHLYNGVARNCHQVSAGYANADGMSSELGNSHIYIDNCQFHDCTDGGLDVKSSYTFGWDIYCKGNKRNFRTWHNTIYPRIWYNCISESPILREGTGDTHHFGIYGPDGLYREADHILIGGKSIGSANHFVTTLNAEGAAIWLIGHDNSGSTVQDVHNGDGSPDYVVLSSPQLVYSIPTMDASLRTATAGIDYEEDLTLLGNPGAFKLVGSDVLGTEVYSRNQLIVPAQSAGPTIYEVELEIRDRFGNPGENVIIPIQFI